MGVPADYKYLTIEDLIEMLQVTRSTIYNLKKKGLPFIKIGSNVRFEQSEVIDWLKIIRIRKRSLISRFEHESICYLRCIGLYCYFVSSKRFLIKKALNSYEDYSLCGRRLSPLYIILTYLGTWIGEERSSVFPVRPT